MSINRPNLRGSCGGIQPFANVSFWPILLKKSVSEGAAFRQLNNHSFLALLRKNQRSSAF
ncbi:hypothetical protein PSEUDO8AS_90069 [Pseudomonas sp. 8AS]|nr:hypothetical protein PSEUDO8AS_90069 [Pseudomonas sp. 8AS]